MEKLLEVKDLEIIYKTDDETVYAVNGITFDLGKGETLGLVGETGAGKTTTAMSIMRLLPDNTAKIVNGAINFDGIDIIEAKEADMLNIRGERIAMIFQDPMSSLNPVLTVADQIAEMFELHTDFTKKEIDKKVCEMLELVGIPAKRKNEYPHQFSGGMKQRVVIAMAMACEPQLLIADEPTTALDVTIQAQVLEMMRELKEKFNMAMIFISHDLGIISQVCDKVAIMYAGEIVEYGTARDVYLGKNHHPYTEGLFACVPNIDIESERLNPIEGLMPDPTALPSGCKFHPRCKYCMEICKTKKPDNVSYENGHIIKCHLCK